MRLTTILAASAILALPVAAQTPRPSVRIDTNTPTGEVPTGHTMSTSGNYSTILWKLQTGRIYYASASDANGVTWSTPVRVDDGPGGTVTWSGFDQNAPTAISNGPHVYTFWEDDRDLPAGGGSDSRNVYFARSVDGGLSWGPNVRIDDNYGIGDTPVREVIMAVAPDPDGFPTNDIVHIVFTVDPGTLGTNDANEIYVATSTDGGDSFGAAVSVSTENGSGTEAVNLSAWAEGETLHVIWCDDRAGASDLDMFYRRSDDAGITWAFDEIQIDSSGPLNGDVAYDFSVRSHGDMVVAGWQEFLGSTSETQLRIATSLDGGNTWNADIKVGDYPTNAESPQYALFEIAANGNIIAAWHDYRSGPPEVYVAVSTDMGVTYTETQVSTGGAAYPRITPGDDGLVVMAFTGNRPSGTSLDETRSVYSTDFGVTWSAPLTISDTIGDSDFAEIVVNNAARNSIHAWRDDGSGANQLFAGGYGATCIGGATFRNGGTNPESLMAYGPWTGGTLDASLDVGSTGHAAGLLVAYATPWSFTLGNGATVLVNPADPNGELLQLTPSLGPVVEYSLPVPGDVVFCGIPLSIQGAHIGGVSPFKLSNAYDLVISGF